MPQMNLPLNPTDVMNVLKAGAAVAEAPVRLLVVTAPELAEEVLCRLGGEEGRPSVRPEVRATSPEVVDEDTCVLVVTSHDQEESVREVVGRAQWPAGGVVIVMEQGRGDGRGITWFKDHIARVGVAGEGGWDCVWRALVWAAGGRAVPLARRYPVLREPAARRLIANASLQNAAVGAFLFVPGTDLAVMTLNQMRLVLNLAALYGQEIGVDRLVELVAVLGAGLGFRAAARQVVGLVPGVGWAVKGGIGYAGTKALGEAALRYFEGGAPLAVHTIQERAARLVHRLRRQEV